MHTGSVQGPPATAAQLYNTALMYHRQGRLAEAEAGYRAVLAADGGHFDAMEWLGALCVQLNRLDEGIEWLHRAAEGNVAVAAFHANLGTALAKAERLEEAIEPYRRALELDPGAKTTLCDLGQVYLRLGRAQEAVEALERLLAIDPRFQPAFAPLARAYVGLDRYQAAADCFAQVTTQTPDLWIDYGSTLAVLDRHEEAIILFRRLIAAKPGDAHAWHNLGTSLSAVGRIDEALAAFARALEIVPDLGTAECAAGNALLQHGRLDEARMHFEKAVAIDPDVPDFHRALVELKRFTPDDPEIAELHRLEAQQEKYKPRARAELFFALWKVYHDLKDYGRAFRYLEQANTVKRGSFSFDETAELAAMQAFADAFTAEVVRSKSGLGHPSELPVFIVGMPRSGTSLVEQVLASHPAVFGGGEHPEFGRAAGFAYDDPSSFAVSGLAGPDLHRIAEAYLAKVRPKAPEAKRIIDKLPVNYILTGLIHLVFPKARVIYVKRDAADICFSNYTKHYSSNIPFAYDLRELAHYTRACERVMDHWHAVLPAGAIIDVQYETLVSDFAGEARRIVAACGLEWDERCAAFYETGRNVRTASAAQVRQPVFNSSIGRWRPYRDHLGALFEALGMTP